MLKVKVDCLAHDQGSIVTFYGTIQETEEPIEFICDHRMAQDIIQALRNFEPDVIANIESWQIKLGLKDLE